MKSDIETIVRISKPPEMSDLFQLEWLIERFGTSLGSEMFCDAFYKIVKEFQKREGDKNLDVKFTLTIECQ